MGVPLYSSCVLIGCLVLFFNLYTFFTDKKKKRYSYQTKRNFMQILFISCDTFIMTENWLWTSANGLLSPKGVNFEGNLNVFPCHS